MYGMSLHFFKLFISESAHAALFDVLLQLFSNSLPDLARINELAAGM
jgi:hypothetical protein